MTVLVRTPSCRVLVFSEASAMQALHAAMASSDHALAYKQLVDAMGEPSPNPGP